MGAQRRAEDRGLQDCRSAGSRGVIGYRHPTAKSLMNADRNAFMVVRAQPRNDECSVSYRFRRNDGRLTGSDCGCCHGLRWVQIKCWCCGSRNVRMCVDCAEYVETHPPTPGDYRYYCGKIDSEHVIGAVHDWGQQNPAELPAEELWAWATSAMLTWPTAAQDAFILGNHFDGQRLCQFAESHDGAYWGEASEDQMFEERCYCVQRESLSHVTVICRTCGPKTYRVCDTHVEQVLEALDPGFDEPPLFCSNAVKSHEIVALMEVVDCAAQ